MPETPRHGAPIWVDLTVQDLEATTRFYAEVFGWEFTDTGPQFGHYHRITRDGHEVGGLMRAMTQEGEPLEAPTVWTVYLETTDIEETVRRAEEAGGQVMVPAMPVHDMGSMAVLIDPAGAVVGVWQRGTFDGFDLPLTAGTPVWFESMSVNFDAALDFYRDVFDWEPAYMAEDGTVVGEPEDGVRYPYVTAGAGDEAVAGLCDAKEWFDHSQWRWYVSVEDADATVAAILARGGTVLDGPMDSPFGRVATVADPEGASFQINQPPA
ncbi:MAG: VOC family protein [Nesterenkonia sp.]|uniref:VOC family protein n=1 Tax=Nesterenkonia marinintestina TaxID=2979865 RepID=UPI0021C0FC20|nr:VOC family protein [Nesterenkonia sp. GX14115]MDO5492860.1 VOC family protein [Nesterenkonia sp.]